MQPAELKRRYHPLVAAARGHVFVVMLAYLIIAELARRWQELDTTVEEGINALCTLCATEVLVKGVVRCCIQIPGPASRCSNCWPQPGSVCPMRFPAKE